VRQRSYLPREPGCSNGGLTEQESGTGKTRLRYIVTVPLCDYQYWPVPHLFLFEIRDGSFSRLRLKRNDLNCARCWLIFRRESLSR